MKKVSPIDGNGTHVLAKLGFTSRAQIAAWVTERQAGQQRTT
jgi:DNA-binding CsgD family transcriptional regulator